MFIHNGTRPEAILPEPVVADAELARVLRHAAVGPVAFYPTNSTIFAQGEPTGPLFLVEFGTVRICRISGEGRRQIVAFHFAGDVFGFEAGAERQCYAESVDGAGVRTLRVRSGEEAAESLLQLALRSAERIQRQLLLLGRASAGARLARLLLDLMDRQESDDWITLQMQRVDIADFLGMTFETVSRVLHAFREQGLVQMPAPDRILVPSRSRLEALCE